MKQALLSLVLFSYLPLYQHFADLLFINYLSQSLGNSQINLLFFWRLLIDCQTYSYYNIATPDKNQIKIFDFTLFGTLSILSI